MKKLLFVTFFLALFSTAYCQDFSYSFEGQLDQSSINKLEQNCANMVSVQSTKVKYKEDSQKGEIMIFLVIRENQRAEADNQFNATDIKKIIIDSGLTPGEF
ncbi:MAG: hypothetical protein QNL61_01675, partial [Crocinitomicaceae bacterium]